MDWRSKYRNPSPPPGYVEGPRPQLVLKKDLIENDGEMLKFLSLIIKSGVLDDSDQPSDFSIQTSDDEVKLIPVAPKVPPVIDLDVECLELSDGEIPSTPEAPPVPKAESCAKKPSVKVKETSSSLRQLKEILPQPVKVKKHTKKEKVVEYSSDSSSSESYKKKKKKKSHAHEKTKRKHHSRSPSSPERNEDVDRKEHKFNPTHVKQEDNLFGQYFCEVCKLSMNAEGSFQSHLNGKRHLKALKSQKQNIAQSVENSLISNVIKPTRYPTAPPDIVRIRVSEIALLQRVVEERAPCPALEKVVEIQGMDETHYYCELCDAPCSSNSIVPHLKGRKHQLMCLSFFDELRYESIKNKTNRRELDSLLIKYLKNIQSKRGLGYMTVEKEIERNDLRDPYANHGGKVVRREDIPGPSHRHDYPEDRLPETFQETLIPDTSKADFYCPTCDSHMNNISMWEAHIRGKRHLKNVKKAPGEGPSKTRSYPLPGERAMIMDELDQVREPVVGLQFIRETQNPEVGGALYNCFPCGACLTSIDIIDHILSQKHRTKFLEKINNRDWQTLSLMNIQESRVGSLIEEACMREEEKNGRGTMEVHVVRSAVPRW